MKIILFVLITIVVMESYGQLPKSAYVVNTLGEDLTVIDLENHAVRFPSIPLGYQPNSVEIRNEKAYTVISGSNRIHILDLNTLDSDGYILLSSSTNPYDIDFINDSIAAVSELFANKVAFVDVNNRTVRETVNVGIGPQGVKYHDGRVYVANSGYNGSGYDPGKISVIDLSDYSVSEIAVSLNPQAVDIDREGNIIVACSGDYVSVNAHLDMINPDSSEVYFSESLALPVTNIFINSRNMAFLSTYLSAVMVYDLTGKEFLRDQNDPLQGGPGVAFDNQDNAYIGNFETDSVYVYTPAFEKIQAYLAGDGPISLAIYDPDVSLLEQGDINLPGELLVSSNFPNPFNPSTTIEFELSGEQVVQVSILDSRGSLIREVLNEHLAAGIHRIRWDGKNSNGLPVASGIYFYRIQTSRTTKTGKMHLLR
jgi:hypothetical protein